MTAPKPADANACAHAWSDRELRGQQMRCKGCGRTVHWSQFAREQAERIAELEVRLRSAELALCAYDDPTVPPGMARAHFAKYGVPPGLLKIHAAIQIAAGKAKLDGKP